MEAEIIAIDEYDAIEAAQKERAAKIDTAHIDQLAGLTRPKVAVGSVDPPRRRVQPPSRKIPVMVAGNPNTSKLDQLCRSRLEPAALRQRMDEIRKRGPH